MKNTGLSEASTAITKAVMDALEAALEATRPGNPYGAAVAGLLGAVLAVLARNRGPQAPEELPALARRVADQLVQASLMLARTLDENRRTGVH